MLPLRYLYPLTAWRIRKRIGNKAKGLYDLQAQGFLIPETYVCSWEAYQHYLKNDIAMVEQLRQELVETLDAEAVYVVRSSANIEDQFEQSFAGQFKSVLHVQGVDAVLGAIWSIWATAQSQAVESYLATMRPGNVQLKMAVIIQKMISPVLAGVAFSKNPITGMDEVIIEAVQGCGAALVQEGVTPLRWVYKWGAWVETPPEDSVYQAVVEQLVRETRRIAALFKKDLDMEWVFDGEQLYWLQMREITSIQEIDFYSNKLAKDMLPGLITPLVFSVNVPLVSGAWIELLSSMIGKNELTPQILVKHFHYRAYFNMGKFGQIFHRLGLPREALEMMIGAGEQQGDGAESKGSSMPRFKPGWQMLVLVPRLVVFMTRMAFFHHQVANFLPAMDRKLHQIPVDVPESMATSEKLAMLDTLVQLNHQTAHFNIVGPLLMMIYSGMLRGQLKKLGIEADTFNLLYGLVEIQKFNPAPALTRLSAQFAQFDEHRKQLISASTYQEFLQIPAIEDFQQEVALFLGQYGHLSDSGNDFASVPWRENPELILQLIRHDQAPRPELTNLTTFPDLPLQGMHRLVFGHIYRRARLFRFFREYISSVFTYGMGLFRVYYLSLGKELMAQGHLEEAQDIFFLYDEEVRRLVQAPQPELDAVKLVRQRKQEMEAARAIDLPGVIYGDDPPPVELSPRQRLTGTATSRGVCTGRARVVCSMKDFHKIQAGEILVVPFSDVSWSPLFAKAGGVIAECGGLLAHSSIIAREYGIPAVVSVQNATRLLDGLIVTVDGYKGEIILHDTEDILLETISATHPLH